MNGKNGVKIKEIVERFDLEVLYRGTNYDKAFVTMPDLNRPGLQLMGFYDYFDHHRLQVIGKAETMLLAGMEPELRRQRLEGFFQYDIPALIIARDLEVLPECMETAQKYGRTLLRSSRTTVECTSRIIEYLNDRTAPSITRHGVLLDIYGEGVLITGDSGIGKSETAVELVKRGHRLVADDAVDIRKVGNTLMGRAPELIRHYIELRGIGIVDVQQLFGMSAVKHESKIDLVVVLERWQDDKMYDRLGIDTTCTKLMDVSLPEVTIPVMPGRNLAVIVEVAAMNNRHKKYGFNAAVEFTENIDRYMSQTLAAQQELEDNEDI